VRYAFNPSRLRLIRREFKLSRNGLGKQVGLCSDQIKNWEVNDTRPSMKKLELLCDKFNKDPNFFFTKGEVPK